MHFSASTIVAAASLFATISAAPAPASTSAPTGSPSGFRQGFSTLDANGELEWTYVEGGRRTTIPIDKITGAQNSVQNRSVALEARGGPKADVGGWTNAGQVAQYAASYACEKSGEYGVSTTIDALASDACNSLLASVPGAPIAEKAWNVYQAAAKPDASGGQFSTIYRFFYNSASAPKLTESICSTVFDDLTNTFCQGKGDRGTQTRGGEMKIGTGDDYLMIGFDPNSV